MTNVENLTNLTTGFSSIGRTRIHSQGDSQLCHSFAIVSALRQALMQFLKTLSSIAPETIKDIEEQITTTDGKYCFRLFLVNFIGNVNPRSYQGLFKSVAPDWFSIENQTAVIKTVIERMTKRTTFEIEGWKRILAVRNVFEELKLNIDDYKMEVETVQIKDFRVNKILYKRPIRMHPC